MTKQKLIASNLLFIIIFFISGCSLPFGEKQAENNDAVAPKKKILMVVAPIDFRDQEYAEPRSIFEQAGFEVKTASIQGGIAKGVEGLEAKIDLTVSEANPEDFDAVIFVGGAGMEQILADDSLQILAIKFYNADKLIAAISSAPSILARAGLLAGKKAVSRQDEREDLIKGKAEFISESVVADGKIITANGPGAAKIFGEKITEALK